MITFSKQKLNMKLFFYYVIIFPYEVIWLCDVTQEECKGCWETTV